jgi:hypothetical protein
VDPEANPGAFLAAIPSNELQCLESAFGSGGLLNVIGKEELSSDEAQKLRECVSEETARRILLGMFVREGASDETATCLSDELEDVNFVELFLEQEGEGFGRLVIPLMRAMFTCVSEDEFARIDIMGSGEEGGPTFAQLECLFANASDDSLVKFFEMTEGGREGVMPPPELFDLIIRCGVQQDDDGGSGPPPMTAEQLECVKEAITEMAFNEIFSGARPPELQEALAIGNCGVDLVPEEENGDGGSGPPLEQLQCIIDSIGQQAFEEFSSGSRVPTLEELAKMAECGLPPGSVPGG